MFTLIPRTERRNGAVAPVTAHPLEWARRFDDAVDRLFNGYFNNYAAASQNAVNWGVELRETEKEVVVSLDAPGFESNEFDIQASEDGLTVSAEHVVKEGDETRTERSLKRQVSLPSVIDPSKVDARYRNGVLELRFAKAEPARWKKVEVKGE